MRPLVTQPGFGIASILIITFLKFVVNIEFKEPLDLLWLGAGIFLVAFALAFHTKKSALNSRKRRPVPDADGDDAARTPRP